MQTTANTVDNSELIFEEFRRYLALSEDMVSMSSKDLDMEKASV